jgi:hypothetical protein
MAGGLPVMAWWVVVGKKKLLLWLKEAKRRFSTFGRSLDYFVHSVSSSESLMRMYPGNQLSNWSTNGPFLPCLLFDIQGN